MIDIGSLQQHKIRFSDGVLNKLMQHTCFDFIFSHSHFPSTSTLFPTDPPFFNTQSHQVKSTLHFYILSRSTISKSHTHPSFSSSPLILTLTSLRLSSLASLDPDTTIYLPHSPSLFLSFSPPSFHTLTFPTRSCLDLFSLNSNPQTQHRHQTRCLPRRRPARLPMAPAMAQKEA
jgi:hypothetical protein